MEILLLDAKKRNSSVKAKALRRSSRIPAVYYGQGKPTVSLELDYQNFRKLFEKAGENTVIELTVDNEKLPVLVHEVQFDPVSDAIAHVDFIHVDMNKEVTTSVRIHTVGVAPAVKNLGGILDTQKHEVRIRCLPKDLIHVIEVDVTPIVDFHTSIHVKDLKVPSTVKILDNADDTVVTATPQKVEEEAKAPAETVAATGEAAAASGVAAAPAAAGTAPAAGTKEAGKEGKK